MSKQIQDAYIVAATRTPIGRSHKGSFKHLRPDDLLAHALRAAMAQVPSLDPKAVEDVIAGCAIPEAQQGLNVARIGAILAGLPNSVGGITVNRFCASGLSAVAMAADRIRVGEADVMIAAGVESMTRVPMYTPSALPARHGMGSYMSPNMQTRYPGVVFSQFTDYRKRVAERLEAIGAKHSKIKTSVGRSAQTLLMPGTTLIREWDEREYRVTVTPEGLYALDGQVFKSLSAVARHITGTHWSGPKFFGLRDKKEVA